jgi:hypothetical protein
MAALAAAGCASASGTAAPGRLVYVRPARVVNLTSIATLKTLFNRADGHARLVLIFSPT